MLLPEVGSGAAENVVPGGFIEKADSTQVRPRWTAAEIATFLPPEAKPGITGLWQVAGRSRTTFDEMVRLDLRYARRRSLWTDIKILLATPAAVISGKGAG